VASTSWIVCTQVYVYVYVVVIDSGVEAGASAEVVWRSPARRVTHCVESWQSTHHRLWSGGQLRAHRLEHRGLYNKQPAV